MESADAVARARLGVLADEAGASNGLVAEQTS
jgi:hypothetical protein